MSSSCVETLMNSIDVSIGVRFAGKIQTLEEPRMAPLDQF